MYVQLKICLSLSNKYSTHYKYDFIWVIDRYSSSHAVHCSESIILSRMFCFGTLLEVTKCLRKRWQFQVSIQNDKKWCYLEVCRLGEPTLLPLEKPLGQKWLWLISKVELLLLIILIIYKYIILYIKRERKKRRQGCQYVVQSFQEFWEISTTRHIFDHMAFGWVTMC